MTAYLSDCGTSCLTNSFTNFSIYIFGKLKLLIPGNIWQPLCSQTWPLKSMCHYKIIQKWCVLFPDFVLLVYNTFLDSIIESFNNKRNIYSKTAK